MSKIIKHGKLQRQVRALARLEKRWAGRNIPKFAKSEMARLKALVGGSIENVHFTD